MIFALIAFPGYSETNSAIHWIKQIGNGENVNEPIFPAISYDLKFFEYMKTFPPAKELSFLRCMRTIDPHCPYHSVSPDTYPNIKEVPIELIAKVLSRKKPVINTFDFKISPEHIPIQESIKDSKTIYKLDCGAVYNYLAFFQMCILNMLIKANDLRFENEAGALLDYLIEPINWEAFNIGQLAEVDARLSYTTNSVRDLKKAILNYLNLFRKIRGEKQINPYARNKELYSIYNFGKNCDYYNSAKLEKYMKKPSRKPNWAAHNKIAEDFRNQAGVNKQNSE